MDGESHPDDPVVAVLVPSADESASVMSWAGSWRYHDILLSGLDPSWCSTKVGVGRESKP